MTEQDGASQISSLKQEIAKSAVTLGIILFGLIGVAELTSHIHPIAGITWGFATIGALGVWASHVGGGRD